MKVTDELDCKIFVDININVDEFTSLVASILAANISQSLPTNKVVTSYCEIYVIENDYFDNISRSDFPSGFIAFRYFLEIYVDVEKPQTKKLVAVTNLLNFFWTHGIPAIAACDYEDKLPEQGGYGSRSVPWPNQDLL